MERQAVIFDLDGTLANIKHRLHHIKEGKPNWDAFNRACNEDLPEWKIIRLAREFSADGYHIIICTGRMADVRDKTEDWLQHYDIPYHRLYMRQPDDFRSDVDVKKQMLELMEPVYRIYMVFEDRNKVVKMYRDHGLTCLQVRDGDY